MSCVGLAGKSCKYLSRFSCGYVIVKVTQTIAKTLECLIIFPDRIFINMPANVTLH